LFALHCSPVRLALRVLNQYEPRNHHGFHSLFVGNGGTGTVGKSRRAKS
jgi:hypothetical protein